MPITHQRFNQMRDMFDDYVRARTLHNWKFWVVSSLGRRQGECCSQTRLCLAAGSALEARQGLRAASRGRNSSFNPSFQAWASWPAGFPVMGWERREEPLGGGTIALPTESPKGSLGESEL